MSLLYGIRYNKEKIANEDILKEMTSICINDNNIPIIIKGDVIYLTNSTKQTFEKNIEQLKLLICYLNKNSTISYLREHIVSKCIENIGQDHRVRENEFSSYLEALTRGGESWKSKFFVIRDNFLLYFKDEFMQKPEGVITLEESLIKISSEYENCFEISNTSRLYHLRVQSSADVNIWVQKLKEASKLTIESKYELKELIGQGTFAKVKRGIEKSTGNNFAIKIINKDAMAENRDSIMTEITILKNVSHPNIIKLHHVFETRQQIYLVADLLKGGELYDLIVERGHLSESESSRIIRRIIQGVEYLHSKKICHRDLKPENILLNVKGDVSTLCITDFGLSKISCGNKFQTACGTPSYVAPEIISGDSYGFEVDIWSCGVILYVLLCGFPPFYADNDPELYKLIQAGEYSFPSPYWDDVSDTAKDLIRKMLVVDPTKRLSPIEILLHPFITNYKSLSFIRNPHIARELSEHLVTQKKVKKRVKNDSKSNTTNINPDTRITDDFNEQVL